LIPIIARKKISGISEDSDELDSDYDNDSIESTKSNRSMYKKSNDYLLTEMVTIRDIVEIIQKRSLHDKLLKFICPYFKLQLDK